MKVVANSERQAEWQGMPWQQYSCTAPLEKLVRDPHVYVISPIWNNCFGPLQSIGCSLRASPGYQMTNKFSLNSNRSEAMGLIRTHPISKLKAIQYKDAQPDVRHIISLTFMLAAHIFDLTRGLRARQHQ